MRNPRIGSSADDDAMKRSHLILLLINLVLIIGFGVLFIGRRNYEFIIYVAVIIGLLGVVWATVRYVDYTLDALIGLTVWSAMHLAGGGVPIGDGRLYDIMVVRLTDAYPIIRYDQVVHIWGFGACTLVAHCLLRRALHEPGKHWIAVGFVLIMAGLGMGALNEIVEFIAQEIVPDSGVGGYENTALDLCADLIGAVLGVVYIRWREWRA